MPPPVPRFDPKKILLILHGSLGDITRALPLASTIRQGFPRSFLAWSVEPAALPLLQGNPAIDEIMVFDRSRAWRAIGPFLSQIRSRKFDLVLDLQRHLKSGLLSWATGARQRLGFNRADAKELNWLFNNLHIEAFGDTIPKLEHYLKFADYLGLPRSAVEWRFDLSAEEQAAVKRHLSAVSQPFAVLFVGTRWESKQWFAAQIAQCVELLQHQFQLDVVLLGGKPDQQLARDAVGQTKSTVANLVGCTSLREAIGIIKLATLAIGPDTGLMHIAAAVCTPVISLWGATSPQRTGPYGYSDLVIQGQAPCVPCNRRRCHIGRLCMQSITTEQISERIALVVRRDRTRAADSAELV